MIKKVHTVFYNVLLIGISDSSEGQFANTVSSGIPIASASGNVCVTAKVKQIEGTAGPKLDVEIEVGAVHLLLYPQQLHNLIELVTELTNKSERQRDRERDRERQRDRKRDRQRETETEMKREEDNVI